MEVCKVCKIDIEDISHLLYDCTRIKPIWNSMQGKICDLLEKDVNITIENIVGLDPEEISKALSNELNTKFSL